jgi:cbb3-type cytochrome oxidase maturation protein
MNLENAIPDKRGKKKKYMEIIFLLIGLGVLVAGGFLVAFIWAMRSGQYEDDYTPSVRILWDDKKNKSTK